MSAKNYNVIIIGTDAAGLMCSIQAAKKLVVDAVILLTIISLLIDI